MGLQCEQCMMIADPGQSPPAEGCLGTPSFLRQLLGDPKGHKVVAVSGSVAVDGLQKVPGVPCRKHVQQFLCLNCGGWSQGRGAKLNRVHLPPTRKGKEVLQAILKGMGPNPKLRAVIDRAIPFSQVDVCAVSARANRQVSIVRQVQAPAATPQGPLEPPPFEVRMNALVARNRAKEQARAPSDFQAP